MATQNQQSITEKIPLKEGVVFGVGAYLVGYIVTLAMVATAEAEDFTEDLLETSGWIYYNAQLADVEISVQSTGEDTGFGALFDGTTINYVTDSTAFGEDISLELPSVVYHLVPIIALLLFGFAVARYVGTHTTQDGAIAGAALTLGVLPLSLLGTFIFSLNEDGIVISPALTNGVLFVGLLFPLVFGAIGGALSTRIS